MNFWKRLRVALRAFREGYLSTDTLDPSEFTDPDARRIRYAILWAFFENTAYRDVLHTWSKRFRAEYGLYRYARNIYNPAARLGNFWRTHLYGGSLDPEASDGSGSDGSAIPIVTENATIREALAQLWQNSNWSVKKGVWTLYGTIFGDVGLEIVDDRARQKVYLKVVHPSVLTDVTFDAFGNVKGYVREETRPNPGSILRPAVTYREEVTRDGDNVVYQTFMDGLPYAWSDNGAEWEEPYGFVPLVVLQHIDVGLDWGWSELFPGLAKIRELDDLAAMVSDQVRKTVNAPWLFNFRKPESGPTMTRTDASTTRPEPGREETPALYIPDPNAKGQALIAPLDLTGTLAHITGILEALEAEYPELRAEKLRLSGGLTGRALALAQQPAEAKVRERRAAYDDALVRAHMMGVAIGGHRGYDGFEGFSLDSYGAGALDHRIGRRPVFGTTRLDQLDEELLFWKAAVEATRAGTPIELFLERQGWEAKDLAKIEGSTDKQIRDGLARALGAGGETKLLPGSDEEGDEDADFE